MSEPTTAQVLSLSATHDQTVPADYIDENGHMNITDYFRLGAWSAWQLLTERATGPDYIARQGSSFFTVEHAIAYLGELREGQRLSVHAGIVGRTDKAVHAASYVVDREHDRLACVMELVYVHVSMDTRRAAPIPDDVAAGLDREAAASASWLPAAATRLTLRRRAGAGDGTLPS